LRYEKKNKTLQKKKTTVTSRRNRGRSERTVDEAARTSRKSMRLVDEHRLRATARRPPILYFPACPKGKQLLELVDEHLLRATAHLTISKIGRRLTSHFKQHLAYNLIGLHVASYERLSLARLFNIPWGRVYPSRNMSGSPHNELMTSGKFPRARFC
jgi:hypothetical protein